MAKSQNDDPRRKDHGIQSSEGLAQPRVLPQRGMRRGTASQDKNLQFKESKLLWVELSKFSPNFLSKFV
jgi:hypothetical protein